MVRALATVCLLLGLAWAAPGQEKKDEKVEKIDAKKLVGKWESVGGEIKDSKVTVEYTADGKLTGTFTLGKMEIAVTGTYKLDGNKLTQTTKFDNKEQTVVITLTKLTDTEMAGEWDGGKESFTRAGKK